MNKTLFVLIKTVTFLLSLSFALSLALGGVALMYYGFHQLTAVPTTWFNLLLSVLIGWTVVQWGLAILRSIFENLSS